MFSFTRLLGITALAASLTNALVVRVDTPDFSSIFDTISDVDQKATTPADAIPEFDPPATVVSAIDGELTNVDVLDVPTASTRRSLDARVTKSDFSQVFTGSGTAVSDRDCAIEGTSYLTYKLVSNATYDVDSCLTFCAKTKNCVFANLYYEFNNPLLDFTFSEKSNLKCALFGDFHDSSEKTNCGGQQLQKKPAGKTYQQKSTGYALSTFPEPAVPAGFEQVFGPPNGANNAPGYMGYVLLSNYDVSECAHQCDIRNPDSVGGACKYFNIWRALKNGSPQSYTCSMYFTPADASTAVNYGQGAIKVTESRGYKRSA